MNHPFWGTPIFENIHMFLIVDLDFQGLHLFHPTKEHFTLLRTEQESKTEWEVIDDADCPSVENVAQARKQKRDDLANF